MINRINRINRIKYRGSCKTKKNKGFRTSTSDTVTDTDTDADTGLKFLNKYLLIIFFSLTFVVRESRNLFKRTF